MRTNYMALNRMGEKFCSAERYFFHTTDNSLSYWGFYLKYTFQKFVRLVGRVFPSCSASWSSLSMCTQVVPSEAFPGDQILQAWRVIIPIRLILCCKIFHFTHSKLKEYSYLLHGFSTTAMRSLDSWPQKTQIFALFLGRNRFSNININIWE